ncbi:MAG: hypothetical protein RLZZ09_1100 [Pseudomonadota bacterium]|jgi:hypothetical protein
MRNKYAGCCVECGAAVHVGAGYFERRNGRFVVRCMTCVTAGKIAKGKPLSLAQKEASE